MQPDVLLIMVSAAGLAFTLTIGVWLVATNPLSAKRISAALQAQQSSELDVANGSARLKGWFGYWYNLAVAAGRPIADHKAPGYVALAASVGGALFGYFALPGGPLGAIAMPLVALLAWRLLLGTAARRRLAAIDKQLPLLLSSLRANLRAGATAQQAIMSVADEVPAPLGDELKQLRQSLNVAVPLEEALRRLAARVPSREISFLAASIEIAVRSGADLEPQLVVIQDIVVQRTRLQQKLASAVAQVQPTRIIVILATILFAMNTIRDEESRTFWLSSLGIVVAIAVVFLTVLGLWGIRILVRRVENS